MKDPYLILGLWDKKVSDELNDNTVKAAYQTLLRQYPPEREPERFKQIRTAFEQLATHKKRLEYAVFDATPPDFEDVVAVSLPEKALQRPSLKQVQNLLRPS